MITYYKIKENIGRFDEGFLRVRELKPDQNISKYADSEIIESIIKSKFHHWRGEEEPDGLTIKLSLIDKNRQKTDKILKNYKFYGFFDNSKIYSTNYSKVNFEEFKKKLFSFIVDHDDNEKSIMDKSQILINDTIIQSAIIYHLDLDREKNEDKVAEWTTYDVFIAFIVLDKKENSATLIEFGFD